MLRNVKIWPGSSGIKFRTTCVNAVCPFGVLPNEGFATGAEGNGVTTVLPTGEEATALSSETGISLLATVWGVIAGAVVAEGAATAAGVGVAAGTGIAAGAEAAADVGAAAGEPTTACATILLFGSPTLPKLPVNADSDGAVSPDAIWLIKQAIPIASLTEKISRFTVSLSSSYWLCTSGKNSLIAI